MAAGKLLGCRTRDQQVACQPARLVLGWVTARGRVNYLSLTSHLSLPSHHVGRPKSSTSLWLGLMRGVFTCVGWKVTPCDFILQATIDFCLTSYFFRIILVQHRSPKVKLCELLVTVGEGLFAICHLAHTSRHPTNSFNFQSTVKIKNTDFWYYNLLINASVFFFTKYFSDTTRIYSII